MCLGFVWTLSSREVIIVHAGPAQIFREYLDCLRK